MWTNQQCPADLVTFTEEIFNENLHYLCSESRSVRLYQQNLWIWEVVSFYWEKFTILDNFSQLKDLFKESNELDFMEIRVFLLIITSKSIGQEIDLISCSFQPFTDYGD